MDSDYESDSDAAQWFGIGIYCFVIGYRSYFLTDFGFCFLGILSHKFFREFMIAIL